MSNLKEVVSTIIDDAIHYVELEVDSDKVDIQWELANGNIWYIPFVFSNINVVLVDTIISGHSSATIWKVEKDSETIFLKVSGVNHGYMGCTYEGYSFVIPKTKTICVYN